MAKKKSTTQSLSANPNTGANDPELENLAESREETIGTRPRLKKIIIKNFRAIGDKEVEIELDEIVILVGPNNSGKSSILSAYEKVMNDGSNEAKLTIDDFPQSQVVPDRSPTIELHTIVLSDPPGDEWICQTDQNEKLVRERWVWDSPNKKPTRQGFNVEKNSWDSKVPWGAANVAKARRPSPHRIDAFATPETQAKEISDLVNVLLKERIKEIKTDDSSEQTDYQRLMEQIKTLQTAVLDSAASEIERIEKDITTYLSRVFPNHTIELETSPETDIEKTYTPFRTPPTVKMGPENGYKSNIEHQGSGARRTLLWTTLKFLSERKSADRNRPHVLLLDEPEICLHPAAIREARKVLYDLPKIGNWQVIATTHSPVFIDLSFDNTTIVRVSRDRNNQVESTTLFRPDRSRLSNDDKSNLKLLNICDPYVHEFFFGGRIVIVEGDTEYTAFNIIRDMHMDQYQDLHIIRARGKGIIPSLLKVLNQYSSSYSVLHDADTEKTEKGKGNPAWGMNSSILNQMHPSGNMNLIACLPNFESAIFSQEVQSDKPYNALRNMRDNIEMQRRVKSLLDALLDKNLQPPDNCKRWSSIEDLQAR